MKKIAIVTMSYGSNYGNKLQNYAMQEIYNKFGYVAETIRLEPSTMNKVEASSQGRSIKSISIGLKNRLLRKIYKKNINDRRVAFESFNKNILNMTDKIYSDETIANLNQDEYCYFSAGSDQVWNSYFDDFTDTFLLSFVKNNDKKISYAASFGVNDINKKHINLFKENLAKFKDIAVREDAGRDIIKKEIDRETTVVLDPTLLLSTKEWLEFAGKDTTEKKGFALTYFLGDLDKEYRKELDNYVNKHNLQLIELAKLNNKYYKYDPKEFVRLFSEADIVFTDSFHACCFSIIFEKPFWITGRQSVKKNMNSRIETLLENLSLSSRKWDLNSDLDESIDFTRSKKILDIKINESLEYIKRNVE